MKLLFYIGIALFCLAGQTILADEIEPSDSSTFQDSIKNKTIDTTLTQDSIETKSKDTTLYQDSLLFVGTSPITDTINFEKRLYQNPTKALFKSMLVPGWGQYGNKRKFKAFIYASFDIWMISKALQYKKRARDLWDKYDSFSDLENRNKYYDLYTIERNSRNKFTWYAVITSFIAMFDAYVDAHLSGFPTVNEQKLSFDIKQDESMNSLVTLSLHF